MFLTQGPTGGKKGLKHISRSQWVQPTLRFEKHC